MSTRRNFIQAVSGLPFLGGLLSAKTPAMPGNNSRDFFRELGVQPFINAAGTYTVLTASLMRPEVVEAINYAAKQFVPLGDLHDAAGKRIAELIGCEAAMITSGAAAALTVGTAACLTGKNPDFIKRIPDLTGMKSEVIIQKSHRYGYDRSRNE
jgi:L-seryl-tRNA(Ser) seleniumtransferase